jgi:hypothetical protein
MPLVFTVTGTASVITVPLVSFATAATVTVSPIHAVSVGAGNASDATSTWPENVAAATPFGTVAVSVCFALTGESDHPFVATPLLFVTLVAVVGVPFDAAAVQVTMIPLDAAPVGSVTFTVSCCPSTTPAGPPCWLPPVAVTVSGVVDPEPEPDPPDAPDPEFPFPLPPVFDGPVLVSVPPPEQEAKRIGKIARGKNVRIRDRISAFSG